MPALTTARLTCSPLQESDWPFFLALQQHPDVMRFVAENRSVADIREAFDSRLAPWAPGSAQWLCLVVRDTASQTPLGSRVISTGKTIAPKSVFFSRHPLRVRAMDLSLCRHSVILRLTGAVSGG